MWFLIGLLVSLIVAVLYLWLRSVHVVVKWYEVLIAAAGLALLLFGLQNYWATQAEHWSKGTPLTFLLVFGAPGLTLLALSAFLLYWRHFQSKRVKNTGN